MHPTRDDRDAERALDRESRSRDEYEQASRALDNRQYDRAIRVFDEVIATKSSRADGAYYWKAYALNKLGNRDEALAALAEIPNNFRKAAGSPTPRRSKLK